MHTLKVKKERISKCLCQNLFIPAAMQIKDHKILITLKRCITLSLSCQTCNTKFLLFYDCRTYENIFCLFGKSANITKALNLKIHCKELRLAFVHRVNTE